MSVGMRIREAREKAGLKQTELAVQVGVLAHQICSWERGRHLPSPEHMRRLALALKCRIEDLF